MPTPRPRPVPPGSVSARRVAMKPKKSAVDDLKSGSIRAMKDMAARKAASEFTKE